MNRIAQWVALALASAQSTGKQPNFSFLPERATTGVFPKRRKIHKINARKQSR